MRERIATLVVAGWLAIWSAGALASPAPSHELTIRLVADAMPVDIATVSGTPITIAQSDAILDSMATPGAKSPVKVAYPDSFEVEPYPVGSKCWVAGAGVVEIRITIEDGSHVIIAAGSLAGLGTIEQAPGSGPNGEQMARCVSVSTITVPDSDFYTMVSGSEFSQTWSKAEAETSKWTIEIHASDIRE